MTNVKTTFLTCCIPNKADQWEERTGQGQMEGGGEDSSYYTGLFNAIEKSPV